MSFPRYLVVRLRQGGPDSYRWTSPQLVTVRHLNPRGMTKVVYGEGPANFDYPPEAVEVLRDYGVPADDDAADAIWDRWPQDFPPELSIPCRTAGWIAPDGRLYACQGFEHNTLGAHLALVHHGEQGFAFRLETRGWLKLWWTGQVGWEQAEHVTPAQLDTLRALYLADEDPDWRQQLAGELAHIEKLRLPLTSPGT